MNWRSTFKTLIICQLSDNRSFQGYSQLTFPPLVGSPHSELEYSPLHVDSPHCEKCGSATFRIPSTVAYHLLHSVIVAFRATEILSTMGVDIPVNYSFQSYQNPVNSGSWYSRWLQLSELPKSCHLLEMTFLQLSEQSNTWKTLFFPHFF